MTVLYKPVLIESAEQAEALPLWTMATIEHHPQDALPQIAMRIVRGWRNRDLVDGRIPHTDMIGWTALVSIEAEEETRDHPGIMYPTSPPRYPQQSRLVTPWEEA